MKATVVGSCISVGLLRCLKMQAVFEKRKFFFDVLPWNFFERTIGSVDDSKTAYELCIVASDLEKELLDSDVLFVDLYSMMKNVKKLTYNGATRYAVYNKNVQCALEKIGHEHIKIEEPYMVDEYYISRLNEFAKYLKKVCKDIRIVVIEPNLTYQYLNAEFQICKIDENLANIRKEREHRLHSFTEHFVSQLGDNIMLYKMSDNLTGDSDDSLVEVHYLQSDYTNMEDEILDRLNIDYKLYWTSDLNPTELLMQKWIVRAEEYMELLWKTQRNYLGLEKEELPKLAVPNRTANMKRFYTYEEMEVCHYNTQKKKVVFFGAGERCSDFLQQYSLPIEFILDNDKKKMGGYMNNITIKNPMEIDDWKQYFIVVTCAKTDEIEQQLNSYGLHKNEDYILLKEIL